MANTGKKIVNADYITIALSKHQRGDLIDLHKKIVGKSKSKNIDYRKKSKMDIVIEIARSGKKSEVTKLWRNKLFASNTTVSFHNFFEGGSNSETPIRNGIARIKKNLPKFDYLLENTSNPTLSDSPKLVKINKFGAKYVFMFGSLGRKKFVPIDFKYEVYQEPRFAYCIWDNSSSMLQIRTTSNSSEYLKRFTEFLTNSPVPMFSGLRVTRNNFDEFVDQLNGTVRSAKGKNIDINSEYEAKELTSRKDIDVRNATNYGSEMKDYEVYSHGIDFVYSGNDYKLYVGFKTGTIYFKKGPTDEFIFEYIKNAIVNIQ